MANGGNRRLLVVDDEKPIRHLLRRIAERAGFEVDMAADGVEALEMLEKTDYAIAIVDLMMPRLSGYELVQKISMLTPRPVVLVATAMANGDVASLDDSMVRRVIRKPFDIKAVALALVETAAQVAEQRERADQRFAVMPPESVTIAVGPPDQKDTPAPDVVPVEEPPSREEDPQRVPIEEPPPDGQR